MATFLISLVLHVVGATQPVVPSTLELLQGSWKGKGPPGDISIDIAGDTIAFYVRESFWYVATFTLPEGTTPQQLHATLTDMAPPEKDLGAVVYALVEVDGETLSLAVNDGSLEPPESLAAAMSRYDLRRVTTTKSGSSRQLLEGRGPLVGSRR